MMNPKGAPKIKEIFVEWVFVNLTKNDETIFPDVGLRKLY
jgi:hypothetical protein